MQQTRGREQEDRVAEHHVWLSTSFRQALDQRSDGGRPPGLMARTETAPIVTMEVLVEQAQVLPGGIIGPAPVRAMARPSAIRTGQEERRQAPRDLPGNL